LNRLQSLLASEEIQKSKTLQFSYYALMIGFVLGFQELFFTNSGVNSNEDLYSSYLCPEYFQSCSKLFFLPSTFQSWGYSGFYTLVFSMLLASLVFAFQNKWTWAQAILIPPFLIKIFFSFFLTANVSVPFETDHLLPVFFFLFFKNKLSNLKFTVVFLYLIAGLVKLHAAWIGGTYFSSTHLGLPLLSDSLIPIATNAVIVLELILIWFLLWKDHRFGRWVFYSLVFFHLYSIFLVTVRYPLQILPLFMILFHPDEQKRSHTKLSAPLLVLAFVLLANLFPFFVPGDHKLTFEGKALAMDMFDSNRQTLSKAKIVHQDGSIQEITVASDSAVKRISPYSIFFQLKKKCVSDTTIDHIEWNMITSLNGSPFYQLVDQPNACQLDWQPFAHNDWIRLDQQIVGYPEKNFYFSPKGLSAVPTVHEKPRFSPDSWALFSANYQNLLVGFYVSICLLMGIWTFRRQKASSPDSQAR
jgi:hypothetical protein